MPHYVQDNNYSPHYQTDFGTFINSLVTAVRREGSSGEVVKREAVWREAVERLSFLRFSFSWQFIVLFL